MKSILSLFLFVPPFILFSGCGRDSTEGIHQIQLKLHLPKTLEKGGPAYQEFLRRADTLQLTVAGKEGQHYEGSFSPQKWENIPLPEIAFPLSGTDALVVKVLVWDRTKEGIRRLSPVLSGETKLHAKEVAREKVTTLSMALKLDTSLPDSN